MFKCVNTDISSAALGLSSYPTEVSKEWAADLPAETTHNTHTRTHTHAQAHTVNF